MPLKRLFPSGVVSELHSSLFKYFCIMCRTTQGFNLSLASKRCVLLIDAAARTCRKAIFIAGVQSASSLTLP